MNEFLRLKRKKGLQGNGCGEGVVDKVVDLVLYVLLGFLFDIEEPLDLCSIDDP